MNMRMDLEYTYNEGTWTHKSGIAVVKLGPRSFLVQVPGESPKSITGDHAEARAFTVAELYINRSKDQGQRG